MLWCIPELLHNDWSHAFKLGKPTRAALTPSGAGGCAPK